MTHEEILDQLEEGIVRSANTTEDGGWEANIEVKKAILAAFKNGVNAQFEGVYDGFVDKHNLPPRFLRPKMAFVWCRVVRRFAEVLMLRQVS